MAACTSCKRKKRGIGRVKSENIDFQQVFALGGGALASAFSNNLIEKIVKPTNDPKKDANRGMGVGFGKALLGGLAYTMLTDEAAKDAALGWTAYSVVEGSIYAFKVPVVAYKAGLKGIGARASDYAPPLVLPNTSIDPMMPFTYAQVAGMDEAYGHYHVAGGSRMAGTGMA